MTLSQAWRAFKDSMYAMWVYREPEPFSYMRDTNEMNDLTSTQPNNPK